MSKYRVAGLSRRSRPPAGFRWSRLPLRQAWGCPSHMPRQVLMTQPRTTPPYSADVSMEITISAVRELNPQTDGTCTHRREHPCKPNRHPRIGRRISKKKTPCWG
jgi:hypothetical protein